MLLKLLQNIALFIFKFLISVIVSALNGRNIFQLALTFFINFSPVATWLFIFKNAGLIPNDIRPRIFVRLAHDVDAVIFSAPWFFVWCLVSAGFTFVWYKLVLKNANFFNNPIEELLDDSDELENSIELSEIVETDTTQKVFDIEDEESNNDSTALNYSSSSSSSSSSDFEIRNPIIPINLSKITYRIQLYVIPVLFFMIWPVLNFDQSLAQPLTVSKDLTAWFFYVLGHITFPILTAVWLYVFHQQGALKCFSIALGSQNIMGVITHLLFPNAPPWFIHLYGLDAPADYDMPGYAAGLTRVDAALGTHLHSKGFHKSPIVFGAFPSLHSAMAFQVCLFILYYARVRILKFLGVAFVCVQWWATIYLDHHFRLDLIGGVCYSLLAFAIVYPYILRKERQFIKARIMGDFKNGSTLGMRVFRNHKRIEKFFDPYR